MKNKYSFFEAPSDVDNVVIVCGLDSREDLLDFERLIRKAQTASRTPIFPDHVWEQIKSWDHSVEKVNLPANSDSAQYAHRFSKPSNHGNIYWAR